MQSPPATPQPRSGQGPPPWMSGLLLAVLVGAYLGGSHQQQFTSVATPVVRRFAAWNYPVFYQKEYWRLFTAALLHANPMHLAVNVMVLKIMGDRVERGAGAAVLLVVFLAASLAGFITHLLGSAAPAVGASGGVMGVLGLCLWWTLTPGLPQPLAGFVRRWRWFLLAWTAITFGAGAFLPDVSQGAHGGGLLMGMLAGGIFQALGIRPDFVKAFVPTGALPPPPPPPAPILDANNRPMPRFDLPQGGVE